MLHKIVAIRVLKLLQYTEKFMRDWLNEIIVKMLETQKHDPDNVLKEICGYVQFLAL